jgi:hypothetical protein
VHFAVLYVLTFEMRSTLFGLWHYIVAVALIVLVGAIVALFVADMATQNSPTLSRAMDAVICFGWAAVIGFLASITWHARIWVERISN